MAALRSSDSATLPEITARLLAAGPAPFVPPPATVQTLRGYLSTLPGAPSPAAVMAALGYPPALADRVDQRVQVMPAAVIDRMAAHLGVPRDRILWACGGRSLVAPAPALGRRPLWPSKTPLRSPPPLRRRGAPCPLPSLPRSR